MNRTERPDLNRVNYRTVKRYGDLLPVPPVHADQTLERRDSVLLVRLSAIGDAVRLLPAVRYLRANGFDGSIGWAVQPPTDLLLEQWPGVDRVHRIDRRNWPSHPDRVLAQLQQIREVGYRWSFDLHGLTKSGFVSLYSGADFRIGFDRQNSKEGNFLWQHATIHPLPAKLPRILKYIQLLRSVTPEFRFHRDLIRPDVPRFEEVTEAVQQQARTEPILLHPRTSRSRYGTSKEWGVERFRELAKRLLAATDAPLLVTWGPGEKPYARRLTEGMDGRLKPAAPTPDLANLCHLIQRAKLVVSGDTAPCHLADMVDTPLVAIFGSSDHRVSGPLLTKYRLITTRGSEQSTGDIPVERVFRAAIDLLNTAT